MTTKKLPEKRQGFLELNAERTRQLMRAYLPDLPENDAHPFVLDFLFAAWLDDPERGGLSEGEVVAAISCAFGQFLADRYGFYWFVDADEKMGSGLGVMRDEPEIRVFPADIVHKAVDAEERGFLEDIHRLVLIELARAYS
jgi:hypothetical protein